MDPLKTLSEEELATIEPLSEEEIKEALEKGYKEAIKLESISYKRLQSDYYFR